MKTGSSLLPLKGHTDTIFRVSHSLSARSAVGDLIDYSASITAAASATTAASAITRHNKDPSLSEDGDYSQALLTSSSFSSSVVDGNLKMTAMITESLVKKEE